MPAACATATETVEVPHQLVAARSAADAEAEHGTHAGTVRIVGGQDGEPAGAVAIRLLEADRD